MCSPPRAVKARGLGVHAGPAGPAVSGLVTKGQRSVGDVTKEKREGRCRTVEEVTPAKIPLESVQNRSPPSGSADLTRT